MTRSLGCLAGSLLACACLAAPRPNVVVIVADDLGWHDVSYHGGPIPTPNLDALCRQGIELDRHYVTPLCTPTRVCLLTGRYSSRFGNVAPNNERVLPWGTPTMASILKEAGYATAIMGKWHLGSKPKWGPNKFGFDHSYGSLAGGVHPYSHLYKKGPYQITWHRNHELIKEEGHVTDLLAQEAVSYLKTERDQPFFLYLPFTAPHDPFDEPEEYLAKVSHLDPGHQQYAASVVHLDAAVGRIVATLKETGQLDETLLLFFSDNGGTRGEGGRSYPGKVALSKVQGKNTPLRDGKRSVYEGGVRTPAFVLWPGKYGPGRKLTATLHACDWLPTLAAGLSIKIDPRLKLDGVNIAPVLRGTVEEASKRTIYCKSIRNQYSLRHGDWKLIVKGNKRELYNVVADPGEANNLVSAQPEKVAALTKLLAAEKRIDNDALPGRVKD